MFTILCQPIARFDFPVTKEKKKNFVMIRDNGPCCKMESPNSRKEVSKKKKKRFIHRNSKLSNSISGKKKKKEKWNEHDRPRANYPGVTNIVDEQCN